MSDEPFQTKMAGVKKMKIKASQYEEVVMSQPEKKSTAVINKKSAGFTAEEKAAMKNRAQELRAEARAKKNKEEGESDVLARIAELPSQERDIAMRLHEIVKVSAP